MTEVAAFAQTRKRGPMLPPRKSTEKELLSKPAVSLLHQFTNFRLRFWHLSWCQWKINFCKGSFVLFSFALTWLSCIDLMVTRERKTSLEGVFSGACQLLLHDVSAISNVENARCVVLRRRVPEFMPEFCLMRTEDTVRRTHILARWVLKNYSLSSTFNATSCQPVIFCIK